MSGRILNWWLSLRARFERAIAARVALIADGARALDGSDLSSWPLVEIIGREHYREHHRLVPIARWFDARDVAVLESRSKPGTLFHIGPLVDGNRRLTFFELSDTTLVSGGRAIFRLPETVILSAALPVNALARVDRASTTFFLSADGESYRSGGLLTDPDDVAHAMGLKPGWYEKRIDDEAPWLLSGLRGLPLSSWVSAWSPAAADWLRTARAPLASCVIAALVLNLLFASAYLTGTHYWRDRSLQALGPEVGALLDAQREVDHLAEERRVYSDALQQRQAIYPLWGAINEVWKAGGWVSAVRVSEGVVTLRGRASSATEVLTALSKYPQVIDAKFGAAIRQEGGMQEFVIEMRLSLVEKT